MCSLNRVFTPQVELSSTVIMYFCNILLGRKIICQSNNQNIKYHNYLIMMTLSSKYFLICTLWDQHPFAWSISTLYKNPYPYIHFNQGADGSNWFVSHKVFLRVVIRDYTWCLSTFLFLWHAILWESLDLHSFKACQIFTFEHHIFYGRLIEHTFIFNSFCKILVDMNLNLEKSYLKYAYLFLHTII